MYVMLRMYVVYYVVGQKRIVWSIFCMSVLRWQWESLREYKLSIFYCTYLFRDGVDVEVERDVVVRVVRDVVKITLFAITAEAFGWSRWAGTTVRALDWWCSWGGSWWWSRAAAWANWWRSWWIWRICRWICRRCRRRRRRRFYARDFAVTGKCECVTVITLW